MNKTKFVLYDARAHIDEDNAAIMVIADDERETQEYNGEYGDDCLWFEYTTTSDERLIDGKPRHGLYKNE